MCPPGKTPSAPSVKSLQILVDTRNGGLDSFVNSLHLQGDVGKLSVDLRNHVGLAVDDAVLGSLELFKL